MNWTWPYVVLLRGRTPHYNKGLGADIRLGHARKGQWPEVFTYCGVIRKRK